MRCGESLETVQYQSTTNIQGAKQVNLRDDIQRAKNIAAVYDREIMKDDVIFDIEGKLNDLRPKQRASRRDFGRQIDTEQIEDF